MEENESTTGPDLQCRHKVVVADDGEPEEAVEGAGDEEDDAAMPPLLLGQPGGREPLDGWSAAVERLRALRRLQQPPNCCGAHMGRGARSAPSY